MMTRQEIINRTKRPFTDAELDRLAATVQDLETAHRNAQSCSLLHGEPYLVECKIWDTGKVQYAPKRERGYMGTNWFGYSCSIVARYVDGQEVK